MASKEQLDEIDAMLAGEERAIRQAFRAFLADLNSEQVFSLIRDKIDAGDIEGAMTIMDQYALRLGVAVSRTISSVGALTSAELATLIPGIALAIHFDPAHPRAAELVRRNTLEFVRQFTNEQRITTRNAIAEAYETGAGTAATARAFKDSIGLTSRQQAAVANYKRLLERGSGEALSRQLRDRRFDSSVRAAAAGRRALTPEQIDRMVDRYRSRYLDFRAETIARTEGIKATSLARDEAARQALEQTGTDASQMKRMWNATRDSRTRDWHKSMQGQLRGMDEPFRDGLGNSLMFPGDPAAGDPATILNCRCAVTFQVAA